MFKPGVVMVVSPHADDEALGCGALLRHWKEDGVSLHGVLVTKSDVMLHQGEGNDKARLVSGGTRIEEYQKVCDTLNMQSHLLDGFECRRVGEKIPELIKALETLIHTIYPDTVLFPGRSFHQDHRAVYAAMMAALRPRNAPSVDCVLTYEISNYTWQHEGEAFLPNMYYEMSETELDLKKKLCAIYESQRLHTSEGTAEVYMQVARRGMELYPLPPRGRCHDNFAEAFRILYLRTQ